MKTVGILGFGRFGNVLAQLLQDDFDIQVYDINIDTNKNTVGNKTSDINSNIENLNKSTNNDLSHSSNQNKKSAIQHKITFVSLESLLTLKTLFIAVPIGQFEPVIKNIAPHLQAGTTVIDVCSVKVHPTTVMQKELSNDIDIIATHPLFGPDSINSHNILKMMMHSTRDQHQHYIFWRDFFAKKGLNIIEMTPEQHDLQAAMSQGMTHFLGRVIQTSGAKHTQIDTVGFESILEVVRQTCNDTEELFIDLMKYNPYSQTMSETLEQAFTVIKNKLSW